jgi:hypothetical protein
VDPRWPEVEHRFLVDAEEAHRFLDAVQPYMPISIRDPAKPVEFIRTTYFDTDDLTLFRSNQPGGAWRVRIRQYASAPDQRTPALLAAESAFEVVEHAGALRRKERVVGAPIEIARILCAPEGSVPPPTSALSPLTPLLDYSARAIQSGELQPRLTTWFHRASYTASGARVTVDQRIQFAHPLPLGMPGELAAPRSVVGNGPPLVLEVKLRSEPSPWLLAAMQQLFLVTRFSKFRDGLLALRFAERERALRSPAARGPWAPPAGPSA